MSSPKCFILQKWGTQQLPKLGKNFFGTLGHVYKKFLCLNVEKKHFFQILKFWVWDLKHAKPNMVSRVLFGCLRLSFVQIWAWHDRPNLIFSLLKKNCDVDNFSFKNSGKIYSIFSEFEVSKLKILKFQKIVFFMLRHKIVFVNLSKGPKDVFPKLRAL